MYLKFNWNVFIKYIFYNLLKRILNLLKFRNLDVFIRFYNRYYKNLKIFIKYFYSYFYIKYSNSSCNKLNYTFNKINNKNIHFYYINFLNINFLYTFYNSNFESGSPYKRFYPLPTSEEKRYFKFYYVLKSENYCCDLSNLKVWFNGVYDSFFFNYFFFFKSFFFKKSFNKLFNVFNLKFFNLHFFNFSNWLKKIIYFKIYIRVSFREKIKFFRELSKKFWQTWLFYKFDHYIQISRNLIHFYWAYFFLTKTNTLYFFFFLIYYFIVVFIGCLIGIVLG